MIELKTAFHLQADNARYGYVYAIALNSQGQSQKALTLLQKVHKQTPGDINTVSALISIYRDTGQLTESLGFAKKLQVLLPHNPDVRNIIKTLEKEVK